MTPNLFSTAWQDYELLDSGDGQKLERFGPYCFARPAEQADWKRSLPMQAWQKADASFQLQAGKETGGQWQINRRPRAVWPMAYRSLRFEAQLDTSRQLGLFPEQAAHWDWITEQIQAIERPLHIINLFGYTGLATLACAAAGAKVTHVDASPKAVNWARRNQTLSGLAEHPIRWIVDDAQKYIRREQRRGMQYDGILLDPPRFGRGPKGEIWTCLDMLPDLLRACREVLSPQPTFIVLTAYAIPASPQQIGQHLAAITRHLPGQISTGELATHEKSAGRILHQALYARWQGRPA